MLKDIWLVGDHFLRENFDILQDLRNSMTTKTSIKDQLYIYLFYNVVLYFASGTSRIRSLMARVLNSIIEGLNCKERLPKYVVILLDKDLIESLDYFDFGISEALEECVFWLIKEVNKLFEIRRDDIRGKRPGVLGTATKPRVIWVAMLQRPIVNDACMKEIYSKRNKFNRSLEEGVNKFRYHHILFTDNVVETTHFDGLGKLAAKGKTEFWYEIVHQLKLFDSEQINLKPRPRKPIKHAGAAGDMQF